MRGAASNVLNLSQVLQLQYGKKYAVQTAPVFSYGTGSYGTTQYLCIVGSAGVQNFENEYKNISLSLNDKRLYPNPYSNGVLILESNSFDIDEKVQISILNAQGKILEKTNLFAQSGQVTINSLENFENGIYFIQLHSRTSQETLKIMVIH